MDDEVAEELRRRLYERGATEEDLARFREAEGRPRTAEANGEVAAPVRSRTAGRLALAGSGVVALLLVLALLLPRTAPSTAEQTIPPPTPSATGPAAVVTLPLDAVAPAGEDPDDAVAALFEPGSIARSRAEDFGALTALRVAPQSAEIDPERTGSGGGSNESLIRAVLPSISLEPDDLLVLTAVTDRPAEIVWRFTTPLGGRARAGTAVLARSARASVVGGAVRIRAHAVLDGLVVEASGGARVRYRYALLRRREPSPFGRDVSQVDFRCALDPASGEMRCARRE